MSSNISIIFLIEKKIVSLNLSKSLSIYQIIIGQRIRREDSQFRDSHVTTPFRLLSFPFSPPTDDCQCFLYPSTWILSERGRGGFNGRLTVRGIIYSFLGWERLGILVKRYSPLPEEKKKETEREREEGSLSFNVKLRPDSRRISSGKSCHSLVYTGATSF